jgi:hypothetical protein
MFYITTFNKEFNSLEHCKNIMGALLLILMDCTEEFESYSYEEFVVLAEEWTYNKLRECLNKYNISINRLADSVADPEYELAGVMISPCNNSKHLQKTMLKNIKFHASKHEKSSEKYKELKKFYGRTKISDNSTTLVEILNMMNATFETDDTTKHKLFYDFEDYMRYVFENK